MLEYIKKYIKLNINDVFVLLILVIGVLLRTHAYLQQNSLWCDEVFLLENIEKLGYLEMFKSLPYSNQVAPPLFLILSKFVIEKFNYNLLAIRFIPYISSIISLFLFFFLTKKLFVKNLSVNISFLMFALCPQLVVMSQTFKQYGYDVMFSILFLLVVLILKDRPIDVKRALIYGIICSLSFYFSFTLIFLTAALILSCLFFIMYKKNTDNLKYLMIFLLPVIISFLLFFCFSLIFYIQNTYLSDFWNVNFEYYPVSKVTLFSRVTFFLDHYFLNWTHCCRSVLLLLCLGMVIFFRKKSFEAVLLFLCILTTFIAALINVYPFADRLILFLAPIFIIFICALLEEVSTKRKIISIGIISFYILVFWLSGVFDYHKAMLKGTYTYATSRYEEFYKMLVNEKLKENDIVLTNFNDRRIISFYNRDGLIPENKFFIEKPDMDKYESLNLIPQEYNIYFYINSWYLNESDRQSTYDWLNNNCTRIETLESYVNNRRNHKRETKIEILKCIRK